MLWIISIIAFCVFPPAGLVMLVLAFLESGKRKRDEKKIYNAVNKALKENLK